MTVSRRLWRTEFVPGQTANYYQNLNCFGWTVQQSILPAGNSFVIISQNTILRNKAPNLTFYVGGRATVTNNLTGTYPDRVPGMYSGIRPDPIPAGVNKVTAVEELEFWCFNWLANKRSLPNVSTLILQENETITPNTGQRIFICKGELGDYFAADQFVSDGSTLLSKSTTYAFIVENPREQ